jgi:hypothetical protein
MRMVRNPSYIAFQLQTCVRHVLVVVVPALLMLPVFIRVVNVSGDHVVHVGWIEAMVFPSHAGYHLTVSLVRMCGTSASFAAAIVLSGAFGLTVYFGFVLIRAFCHLHFWSSALVSIGLTVAAPMPKWWDWPSVYLGNLSGVVWHNPTSIFALPIGLFCVGAALLGQRGSLSRWQLGLLMSATFALPVLCAFSKPNFLMALAPVSVAALFSRALLPRRTAAVMLAGCVVGLLAYVSVTWVKPNEPINPFAPSQESHSIAIRPFFLWGRLAAGHVISSFLGSLAFPLVATTILIIRGVVWGGLVLAWMVFAMALLQWVFLVEEGPRLMHANFYWALVPSVHLLFVCSYCAVERMRVEGKTRPSSVDVSVLVCRVMLGVHVLSGIWFLYRSTFVEFA